MTDRHRAVTRTLAGITIVGAALLATGVAAADPVTPAPTPAPLPAAPTPASLPTDAAATTPDQNAVPAVAAPPPLDPFTPYVPEIQNPTYGSGNSGGGVFGTLKDLWQQVQNPTFAPNEIMGTGSAAPAAPPGSAPVPALPPGYVSTNFPGSETASTAAAGGPATVGPALPPGYYPITGPPPPGYSYGTAPAAVPPVAMIPATVVPSP
jgi:hypothetical protein